MRKYRPRIADELLKKKLDGAGAVLIEGAKWCGKTTTAEQISGSCLYIADPDKQKQYITMSNISPRNLLSGDTPRLIDEWQLIPRLWDSVRFEVDHRDDVGQFILTGSSVPASTEEINHTGTGRFAWLTMRPMSLYESGDSIGNISLAGMFTSPKEIFAENHLALEDVAFLSCRGGWPRSVDLKKEAALEMAYNYYDAVVHQDVSRMDGGIKDSERITRLMRSLARNQGTQCSFESLCTDISVNDSSSISTDTIATYMAILKKIFVVEDMSAWNPNLRSKTAIRTSDTRYFVDPSIAVAALGLGPGDLLNDLNTFGFIFETLCTRDLRVYADALNGRVYHYRDKNGLECDAVIHLRNGSYGLVEIKLGGDALIEDGARNLKKLKEKIDTTKMKEASFMMILTAIGDYAYKREDDIYVVPIGCLRP